MNWNTFPKMVCDKLHVAFNPGFFHFGFESGTDQRAYLIAPAVAKGVSLALTEKIAEYEAKYGVIDTRGVQSGIESPIQIQ